LVAKGFSDWSSRIVASNRANVNDSKAVDAFGKVENSQSKMSADFSEWQKIKKGRSKLRPLRKQKFRKRRLATLLFLP
jgi:DNA repair ATPase RecN